MTLNGVTAVFLCGGIGKRMFPLMEDKFLFRFLDKTLIEHQMELAKKAGINEFVIIANPSSIERIRNIFHDDNMHIAVQREPRGMADALLSAKELLLGKEIIIANPNDIIDSSAYESVAKADQTCILGYEVNDYFPGGYLVVDGDTLKSIVEKPPPGQEPSNLVNIVVHLHRDTGVLFKALENARSSKDDVYERALDEIAKTGSIKVARYKGKWIPIKYPWHLLAATEHFLTNAKRSIADTAKISEKATIDGNVIIDEHARVLENAVIRGPCYIGKNSVIGNKVLIWNNSHIGDNCVVGYGTEIKKSYIGSNCWFHSSYIGDSVIDDNCSFGAGTVTANFRFDEKNVMVSIKKEQVDTALDKFGTIVGSNSKTGVNTSIMPGIKIGPNSFVGPHVSLAKDLEPNKMILMEPNYRVTDNKVELSEEKKRELMKKLERL